MEATGNHPVGIYIIRSKTTIVERLAWRPMYELCTEAERNTGDESVGAMVGPGVGKLIWGIDKDVL